MLLLRVLLLRALLLRLLLLRVLLLLLDSTRLDIRIKSQTTDCNGGALLNGPPMLNALLASPTVGSGKASFAEPPCFS